MLTPRELMERETIARYHRLLRYENRLIKEGLRTAGADRLGVILPARPDGLIDVTALVELGGRALPALYRKAAMERARLIA